MLHTTSIHLKDILPIKESQIKKKKRILRVLGKQNSSLMIEVKIGVTSGLGASDWEGTQGILHHVEPRSGSRSHRCLSV